MTADKEKIPYIECLYRTGKTVYKWWFITLAVIGVIVGLGFVITSAWNQIVDGFNYIFSICSAIGGFIVYVLSMLAVIPWYWWIGIGVVAGPLLIVAVYCALKRRKDNSDVGLVAGFAITIISIYCVFDFVIFLPTNILNVISFVFSVVWLCFVFIFVTMCGEPRERDYA